MAELQSKNHKRVLFTDQQGQGYDLALPIPIGDQADQCPRHVADALVACADGNADEFSIVGTDPQRASEGQPAATPAPTATIADPKPPRRRKAR